MLQYKFKICKNIKCWECTFSYFPYRGFSHYIILFFFSPPFFFSSKLKLLQCCMKVIPYLFIVGGMNERILFSSLFVISTIFGIYFIASDLGWFGGSEKKESFVVGFFIIRIVYLTWRSVDLFPFLQTHYFCSILNIEEQKYAPMKRYNFFHYANKWFHFFLIATMPFERVLFSRIWMEKSSPIKMI